MGLEIAGAAVAGAGLVLGGAAMAPLVIGTSGQIDFSGFQEYNAVTEHSQLTDSSGRTWDAVFVPLQDFTKSLLFTRHGRVFGGRVTKIQCSAQLRYQVGFFEAVTDAGFKEPVKVAGQVCRVVRNIKMEQDRQCKGGRIVFNKFNESGWVKLAIQPERTSGEMLPEYKIEWQADLKGRRPISNHHGVHGGSWLLHNNGDLDSHDDKPRTDKWWTVT